jgi:hypothetical protein
MMELEYSRTSNSDQENPPILIMTVDISEGYKDNIIIYENSSIPETVHQFSLKHNLSKAQESSLIAQVESNLSDENTSPQEMSRKQYFDYWNSEIDKKLEKIPEYQPKINKKSSELASHRKAVPVYERLYSLSQKSKAAELDHSQKPRGVQCGDRLYHNWICSKVKIEKSRSKALEEKEEEINKTLTFKPQINDFPLAHRFDAQNYQKFKEENLERKRFELLAREQEVCTFAPSINPNSETILQQKFRLRSKNKFEELYEEASIRKEKNEELANQ